MLVLLAPSEKATASRQSDENSYQVGKRYQLSLSENGTPAEIDHQVASLIKQTANENKIQPVIDVQTIPTKKKKMAIEAAEAVDTINWKTAKVKSGDSLAKIFKRNSLNATTTHKVITAKGEDSKLLKKLNVGDMLRIGKDDKGSLVSLEYPFSKSETLFVNLQNQQYHAHKESKSIEIREAIAQGTIKSNFWNAGSTAGLNDSQIINLANVFGWDIDFALDIREGDNFNIIYEEQYIEGEFIGTGKILAAEFINQGETFQAIRFTDDEYYSPNGKSMRKAFLRTPVDFARISSRFNLKRKHPVLNRIRAHKGTDYAARTGTPIKASGDGKIIWRGTKGGFGRAVIIQHGSNITTLYAHMSKYRKGQRSGSRVKQGDIIGYVGQSGLASGPHLHYEFRLNGVHKNPMRVKFPNAAPIPKKERSAFKTVAATLMTQLESYRTTQVAVLQQ